VGELSTSAPQPAVGCEAPEMGGELEHHFVGQVPEELVCGICSKV